MAFQANATVVSVEEQNTNQNEAFTPPTKEASLVTDQFQGAPLASSTTNIDLMHVNPPLSALEQEEQASAVTKSNNSIYGPIPTIQITPAVSDENVHRETSETEENQSLRKSALVNMDWLRPPAVDTTINIARPNFEGDRNVSRLVEDPKCENIGAICRFSSTPVASPNRSNRMSDDDVSMLSISKASPIVPSEIPTPIKNNNYSNQTTKAFTEEINVLTSQEQHKYQNIMFQESQAVSPNPQDTDAFCKVPCDLPQTSVPHHDGGIGEGNFKLSSQLHESQAAGAYSTSPGGYYPSLSPHAGCEYQPGRDGSWTDLSYLPPPSLPPNMTDPCCFAGNPDVGLGAIPEPTDHFVYPSIYVSSAGLISVLLRNDISVEMTVDRTIRVVSHNHMMAAATDSRGTAACLYHPAVKVVQTGNTTDIATTGFRAQMGANDAIVFSNGVNYFRLDGAELQPVTPMKLPDIMRDQSVNLLFSSEGYGQPLVASCMQVAAQAEYSTLPKGGIIVRINGVKVTQTGGGDVTVVTGAKFIRLSPGSGSTRVGNRFVDVEIEKDWSVKLTRGSHSFRYARKRATVCNGKMEAGFDENSALKVTNLAPRHPLLADPTMVRRNHAYKPMRPNSGYAPSHVPNHTHFTPRRRPAPPLPGYGGRPGGGGMGSI